LVGKVSSRRRKLDEIGSAYGDAATCGPALDWQKTGGRRGPEAEIGGFVAVGVNWGAWADTGADDRPYPRGGAVREDRDSSKAVPAGGNREGLAQDNGQGNSLGVQNVGEAGNGRRRQGRWPLVGVSGRPRIPYPGAAELAYIIDNAFSTYSIGLLFRSCFSFFSFASGNP
jgi:hypothetical protein